VEGERFVKPFGFRFTYQASDGVSRLEVAGHLAGCVSVKDTEICAPAFMDASSVESLDLGWEEVEVLHGIFGQILRMREETKQRKKCDG
jgi:hypothetical protein